MRSAFIDYTKYQHLPALRQSASRHDASGLRECDDSDRLDGWHAQLGPQQVRSPQQQHKQHQTDNQKELSSQSAWPETEAAMKELTRGFDLAAELSEDVCEYIFRMAYWSDLPTGLPDFVAETNSGVGIVLEDLDAVDLSLIHI